MTNTEALGPEGAPRAVRIGGWVLGALVALYVAELSLGQFAPWTEVWLYNGVLWASAVGCLLRGLLISRRRLGWTLMGVGLVAWAIGDTWYWTREGDLIPNAGWTGLYVFALPGLWMVCRGKSAGEKSIFWFDAVIGTLAVTAGWAAAFREPLMEAADTGDLLLVAYPLGDLLVLVVLVVCLASRSWRADRPILFLTAGGVLVTAADSVFAWQEVGGVSADLLVVDAAWPASALLVACAAWRPARSPPSADDPVRRGAVPAGFAVLALTVLALHDVLETGPVVFMIAVLAVAVALARMAATGIAYIKLHARTLESEAKLREANRLAGFGHWEWDVEQDVFSGSHELYRLLDFAESRPVGFSELMSRIHEDDRRVVEETLTRAVQEGGRFAYQAGVIRRDGDVVILQIQGAVEMGPRGAVRIFGSAQDVTERVQAERKRLEAEAIFRTAFDGAPVGMTLTAPDGTWIATNRSYREMLGLEGENLIGRPFLDVVHPDDVPLAREMLSRARRGELHEATVEPRYIHRSGREIRTRVRIGVVRDAAGSIVCFVGQVEDLTERERGRAALERLAAIVEASSDAIFSTNVSGEVQSWNRAAEHHFGVPANAAKGRLIQDLVGHPTPWLEAVLRGESVADYDVRVGHDGAERRLSLTAAPIRNSDGRVTGCSCIGHDISERTRAEAERRRLEAEIARIEKLESLGTLAGGIAHDFNNLLAVILNYADFLLEDATDEGTRRDLSELRAAAERGAQLTRQLLVFTRRGVGQAEVIYLDSHVRELESLLSRTIGEDIALEIGLDAPDAAVSIDPSALDQIVMNLAVNARQAMPSGGKLTIQTGVLDGHEASSHVASLPAGRYVAIEVADTGVGMPNDVAERALEPFFTTKSTGTGLGLATVYGAVTGAGGQLSIDSTPGEGTRVLVFLPISDREPSHAVREPGELRTDGQGAVSVLVVEDEDPVREAAARILEQAGFSVACASSGDEAVEVLENDEPNPAVVLTDVVMPGMSGAALAERVRELDPDAKVVFMSGYTEDVLRGGLPDETVNLVEKPFDGHSLRAAVLAALRN